jgi:hypothetical protein
MTTGDWPGSSGELMSLSTAPGDCWMKLAPSERLRFDVGRNSMPALALKAPGNVVDLSKAANAPLALVPGPVLYFSVSKPL